MIVKHDPDNGVWGDCMRACTCSVLELDPDKVPHFAEGGEDSGANEKQQAFLNKYGLFLLETDPFSFEDYEGEEVIHLIYGQTSSGTHHATVGINGKIVHDPLGFDAIDLNQPTTYGMFISINPKNLN